MSWQPAIFNPLAFDSLSGSIAEELTKAPMTPLMTLPPFDGPGIYALYYSGGFRYYAPLSAANKREPGSWPIYIGKAEASTRKGIGPRAPDDYSGNALYRRLKKHTGSIESSSNLDVADFHVRALVLAYVWVPMAETSAIAMHRPLWNTLVDGFGSHDPGRGRYEGMRSRWDTLHPGRRWAEKLRPNVYTARQIGEEALAWLVQQAPEYRIIPLQGIRM